MASLRLVCLSLVAVLVLALAPSAGALVGAQPDTKHSYAVMIYKRGSICSGVAVAPRLVVTAAHCGLTANGTTPAGQTFLVFQGRSVLSTGPSTIGAFFPAAFTYGGDGLPEFVHDDLAVIRVFGPPLAGPYAALPKSGAADSLRAGTRLEAVGYGISEMHGNTPVIESFDGVRRSGDAKLTGSGAVGDEFLKLVSGVCYGDSGGPIMHGTVALAVNSFAPSACYSTSYATRLDTPSARAFLALHGAPLP